MVALGGEGGKAFQFEKIGDGFDDAEILTVDLKQDTDMDDGELKWFYKKKPTKTSEIPKEVLPNLDPVPCLWITVQTGYRNHEGLEKPMDGGDDGTRQVVLAGHKFIELKKVTKDVSKGGKLSMRLISFGTPAKKGWSAPKNFPANEGGIKYVPPSETVSLDSGGTTASAEPAQSAATHGPKPDYLPQAAWDAMPEAERAKLSPF